MQQKSHGLADLVFTEGVAKIHLSFYNRVPTSSGNHGKPGKLLKKFHAWKKHGI